MSQVRLILLLLSAVILCATIVPRADAHGQDKTEDRSSKKPETLPPPHRLVQPPAWLPRYDLLLHLDTRDRRVTATATVTWTNRHARPTGELIFHAHGRYTIPNHEVGLVAKTVELLRIAPKEALNFDGPALDVKKVYLGAPPLAEGSQSLDFTYPNDNPTSLVVALPKPVGRAESVTVTLEFTFKIPPKKGRWGQWNEITTLAQWLPVLAVYDESGWHATPFIPWHQPFYNEAGIYSAKITLPTECKLACSGKVIKTTDLGNGYSCHETASTPLRDFSIVVSPCFEETTGRAGRVTVRCLHLPQHAHYARELVATAVDALPVYEKWFGPYPYEQFTIAEAYLGWNGNECGGMVLIDDRMFNMPHIARGYPTYLVAHELCHQWWYNIIGTNGYCETWMDEGPATYFSHRFADDRFGRNNEFIKYPAWAAWLPNIRREDFRNVGFIGCRARGEVLPTIQELPKYGHLFNLTAATYDRGSKVIGMIEERLGETALFDFLRLVYRKYAFQILRVADFQRELEDYTGTSWDDFFAHWVRGPGMCDWAIERVEIDGYRRPAPWRRRGTRPVRVVIDLQQRGEFNEPTYLGIRTMPGDGYQIYLPIQPEVATLSLDQPNARITSRILPGAKPEQGRACVRVEVDLPCEPLQIAIDPDRVLLDADLANNRWRPEARVRLTPLYTMLDEVEIVNAYDRWNFIAGPWANLSTYNDPWFNRSPLAGIRIGAVRLQEFKGGAFLAYRTDDRNIIAGADGLWEHIPFPKAQVGFLIEKSLVTVSDDDFSATRGVVFGRYVMMYGSSLYLPPFEYVEVFGSMQNRCLPEPRQAPSDALPFDRRNLLGVHYHKYLLTPYWDPEGGAALDVAYGYGFPVQGNPAFHQFVAQASTVVSFPEMLAPGFGPVADWLRATRFALRLGGAWASQPAGLFFTLGGGDHFRGFDLSERQGSITWFGSIEWRIPVARQVCWDFVDHIAGVRNVYLAPFWDVGDAWVNGRSQGEVAHAFGVGLRIDVTWLGLIERTMLRVDVAKTINVSAPWQVWFGITHPF
ncbi:MAG: M1 family aminopeptidase [Gemmataceae bacterium]|nr:M1 family aminopeptidase [Gemmataceae bacterium]